MSKELNAGYIYVLFNPSIQGLVKIGKTTRDPESRVAELSGATGVATPFLLVCKAFFTDCTAAEQLIHTKLEAKGFRVSKNREFFRLPVDEAVSVIFEVHRSLGAVPHEAADADEDDPAPDPAEALFDEADEHYFGYGDTFEDPQAAFPIYQQAAALGHSGSFQRLAVMFERGNGCRADIREALQHYEKAAAAGLLECYGDMARIYLSKNEEENAQKCWSRCFKSPNLKNNGRRAQICVGYLAAFKDYPLLEVFWPVLRPELLSLKQDIVDHLRRAIELDEKAETLWRHQYPQDEKLLGKSIDTVGSSVAQQAIKEMGFALASLVGDAEKRAWETAFNNYGIWDTACKGKRHLRFLLEAVENDLPSGPGSSGPRAQSSIGQLAWVAWVERQIGWT